MKTNNGIFGVECWSDVDNETFQDEQRRLQNSAKDLTDVMRKTINVKKVKRKNLTDEQVEELLSQYEKSLLEFFLFKQSVNKRRTDFEENKSDPVLLELEKNKNDAKEQVSRLERLIFSLCGL